MSTNIRKILLAATLPAALAISPSARWGHQAAYVPSQQAMYLLGGQIMSSGTQITNEVLILPLNTTNPTFSLGPNAYLPPHAFASMAVNGDSSSLVVIGGMTTSCGSDALAHTLDLSTGEWTHASPNSLVRRRGADATFVGIDEVLVVGGIADSYACASSTYTYPAMDTLTLPLSSSTKSSVSYLPTTLTGSTLAVADFAMTNLNGTVYIAGGQSSSGDLVALSTIGKWTSESGWSSQVTNGDVPAGRVGATLVAHPTLDLLVLHGGSTTDDASNDTPSNLLAFLNTTTWTWSTPSNLQPPVSSSAAYHTSIMTSSGVMITAFGLGASNTPRSDVYYLDLRDPTQSTWSWKAVWSQSMLEAYTPTTPLISNTNTNTPSTSESKKLTSILTPILVGVALALPIIIWFLRRKFRIAKKRREARHFSFSSQEDHGDFTQSTHSSPLAQFRASRKNKSYFGNDGNERDSTILSDLVISARKLLAGRGRDSFDSFSGEREMVEKRGLSNGKRISEKQPMNWEEIDFGLGKVDERRGSAFTTTSVSRKSSFSASGSPPMGFPLPIASTMNYSESLYANPPPLVVTITSPRVGTPTNDGQPKLVPDLAIIPPTNPNTPSIELNRNLSTYPALEPVSPSSVGNPGLDWNMLAQELETRPAFRSISPTSTLRSHTHTSPLIPTMDFQPNSTNPSSSTPFPVARAASPVGSIVSINPKTGRRTSEHLAYSPRSGSPVPSQGPRVVSGPGGRQLAGVVSGRRGSMPYISAGGSPGSSGAVTPVGGGTYDQGMRRSSSGGLGATGTVARRESAQRDSRLRVVNVGEEERDGRAM